MSRFIDPIRAADVKDAKSYADFVQQHCGTPYCGGRDMIALHACIKEFKERYPHLADNPWPTLVRAAMWVRSQKKRPAKVMTVVRTMLPWAWADGALPELDPMRFRDEDVEVAIGHALEQENDPVWRDRLIGSEGAARGEVLQVWQTLRSSSFHVA